MIIVKTKIKEYADGMNISSGFAEELDSKVKEMVQAAVQRAEANGRKTVMPKDL